MRTWTAIFICTFLRAVSAADQDPRQAQLQAATVNGTAGLREQVLHTRVNQELMVSDYVQRTNSLDALNHLLDSAQSVGGPRWIDDHTCQVRIELSASLVRAFLMQTARDDSRHSPLRPDALKAKLSAWNRLKFSAVGSSAGGDAIELAQPHEVLGKWSDVTDSARRSAVEQARADAIGHVINELGPIILQGQTRVSDALSQRRIADQFNNWLQHQPVTKIEFSDDLKVMVTVATAPESLAAAFRSAVEGETAFKTQAPVDWDRAGKEFEKLPVSVSGTASALMLGVATTSPALALPSQPPDWIDQQLEADAIAGGGGSRLKTSRIAEANAVAKIRDHFLALHIDSKCTLRDVAGTDPQIHHAIDRAMLHVHAHQVDYRPDGTVRVRVSLDLQEAWDELRSTP